MHYTILLAIWGAVTFIGYQVASTIVKKRRHAAKARQLGCGEIPQSPGCGFLGLKRVRRLQAADAKKRFPDLLVELQDEINALKGRVCPVWSNYVAGTQQLVTNDPENIKALLATFNDFGLGPARRGNMMQTLGDGIFVQDGKPWEHSRALLRPSFNREQVSDLDMEERHLQNLLRVLPVNANDGWTKETNIQTLFFRLTIDAATEFLFGESVDSQLAESEFITGSEKKDELAFSQNFDAAQVHMAKRFRLADFWWLHNPKDYRENNRVVNQFVDYYVDLALQRGSAEKKAEAGHQKKYVFLEALSEQTRDPYELRSQLLNILLAGRDTTASLLSWLFHELLRHPEVFTKLRSTIVETFGTYEDPQEITFATLKGCQYLQFCLNETLRLWAIVPGNSRRSVKDTTLPRGGGPDGSRPVFVPANTEVNYSVHVMHRRKDLWGEDANEFKPERFVGRRPGWEYLPFNGGPRICIGQQFALTEASYVVVRLLQRFDAIQPSAHKLEGPVTSNLTLTSCPGQLVTLRLHEAKR